MGEKSYMTMYYYLKGHLGNVRVTKVGVGEGGSVLQRMNYYPFGGMMASSTGGAVQPYRYTGKELVRFQGLDWLDYGARWYDPAILHWNGVDELAEKNNSVSAYTFCHNNPVNRVDPDGKDDYFSTSGQYIKTVGTGADIYIGKTNFRDLNLMSDRNMKVAARVIGHYARQVGIKYNMNGGTGKVGISNEYRKDNDIAAFTTRNGDIFMNRIDGKLHPMMYNSHNLSSTLEHENMHKQDRTTLGKDYNLTQEHHAEIIINQMKSDIFSNTTSEYKHSVVETLSKYMESTYNNKKLFYSLLNKSNTILSKYSIKLYNSNGNIDIKYYR